jgi:hypothetical protein
MQRKKRGRGREKEKRDMLNFAAKKGQAREMTNSQKT